MKRTLTLLFLSSSAFIVAPAAAQEGSGGAASADASAPPDSTEAGPGGSSGSGGGNGGGGKGSGSGGTPSFAPVGAEPREYDLLENEGKACSISSLSTRSGSGAAIFLAGAAAVVSVRRRRTLRR